MLPNACYPVSHTHMLEMVVISDTQVALASHQDDRHLHPQALQFRHPIARHAVQGSTPPCTRESAFFPEAHTDWYRVVMTSQLAGLRPRPQDSAPICLYTLLLMTRSASSGLQDTPKLGALTMPFSLPDSHQDRAGSQRVLPHKLPKPLALLPFHEQVESKSFQDNAGPCVSIPHQPTCDECSTLPLIPLWWASPLCWLPMNLI
jgi:hypothetical protein